MIEFNDYLTPLIGALFLSVLTFLAMFLVRYEKRKQQELKKSSAELSYMREYFERELHRLNSKLMSNDDRWKEVNHLLLSYNPRMSKEYFTESKPTLSRFFKEVGVDERSIHMDRELIFVLTPFLDDYIPTYKNIAETCQRLGFSCIRGDEEFIQGNVFKFILEKIASARLVIANIDGRNPNVMYELGIAQAIGKPTILIAKNPSDVPFDVKSNYIIFYGSDQELRDSLTKTLSKFLSIDHGKFIIHGIKGGGFLFTLRSTNGEVILQSEKYNTRSGCLSGVEAVRRSVTNSDNFSINQSSSGKYFFNLKDENGSILATSQKYETFSGAQNGIQSVIRNGQSEEVDTQKE